MNHAVEDRRVVRCRRGPGLVATIAGVIASGPLARAQAPAMDGVLSDWSSTPTAATDPSGDSSGPIDVRSVSLQSRGTSLFVRLDLQTALNLSSGAAGDPTLLLVVTRGARSVTVDFRGRVAYLDGNTASVVTWTALGFTALPTFASTQVEMRLDLSVIGVSQGQSVQVSLAGADTLSSPVSFTLSDPASAPARRTAARPTCPTIRIASLNTELSGFIDSARRPALLRLIDSVNADVYVFQEEYNSNLAQMQQVFVDADALENGASWNVLKSGEFVLASPWPLIAATIGTGGYAGAVVRPPGGPDMLVIDAHPKCCGYAGDPNDVIRVNQASAAIASFNSFRAGTLSPALAPYRNAPAVVVGDWNLVGSTTPLDLWLASPAPGLTRVIPANLIGTDAWTWRSANGLGFWPGSLDIAVYDAARMRLRGSFLLDTGLLSAGELSTMGLQAGDSGASDHLLMVLDVGIGPTGDFNGFGGVTIQDLFDFLAAWFALDPRADVNGVGGVTVQDLFDFLARWFSGC